jgi:uncharacterized SAM-binding protein YcdF (DUF218 family)
MSKRTFLIIYGAAVKAGGIPSGSLLRRVQGAWKISQYLVTPCYFIVTGGLGKHAPSEAQVMRKLLLNLGATNDQIIVEDQAKDTMDSTFYCAEHLINHSYKSHSDCVIICSSPYHNYRCQLLLWMLNVDSLRGDMPTDKYALGTLKWLRYYIREVIAIPWDLIHIWIELKFKRTK